MSEERAGYGGGGARIRVTARFYGNAPKSWDLDIGRDPFCTLWPNGRVEAIEIERLPDEPDEPAAPHVEVRPQQAQVFVDGHYAGTVIRLEQRDAEPVFEVLKCGHVLIWRQFPSFEAAAAALAAAAQPAPAEPPMRYLDMEVR